jgi:hypothetical protein
MTTRSQSGSLTLNVLDNQLSCGSNTMIELPADVAGQSSELFDKLIAFTFDVLGRQAVEQRGYWGSARADAAAHTYRERRD